VWVVSTLWDETDRRRSWSLVDRARLDRPEKIETCEGRDVEAWKLGTGGLSRRTEVAGSEKRPIVLDLLWPED
jgi:hypothetical protein